MALEPNKNEIRPGRRQEEEELEDFFERAESLPNEQLGVVERVPAEQVEKPSESEDFKFEVNERQDANALREQIGQATATQDEEKNEPAEMVATRQSEVRPSMHNIDLPSDPIEVQKALTSRQVLSKAEKLPSLYKARVSYVLTDIVRDKAADVKDGVSNRSL